MSAFWESECRSPELLTLLATFKLDAYSSGRFGHDFETWSEQRKLQMQHGARNDIVGEVIELKSGDLMAKARVRIKGEFDLSSVMTADSLAALGVKEGDKVRVLVKAVNVLLVKDT